MNPTLIDFQRVLDPEALLLLVDDNRDGYPDQGVIEAAVIAARADVESLLRPRYHNQEAVNSPLVFDIVRTLAVERLYARRAGELPAIWRERAERSRVLLDEIARGKRAIDTSIPVQRRVDSTVTREQRNSTPEKLRDL